MGANKSKDKGKSFEREVCNYFSKLYSDSFRRVFDSGAFTGGANRTRRETLSEGQIRNHKGDIVPPDDWKFFNCECKSYSEFPFHQLFHNTPILLLEAWIKQVHDAADPGDLNFIVMKFNRKGKYLLVPQSEPFIYTRCIEYTDTNNSKWAFTQLEQFFDVNYEVFKNRCCGSSTK